MKPNFALDFRNDAITLLHRTPRGWQVVGTVGLDAADLAASLSSLRTTALELSPKGMTTKLVIPNAQILLMQVPVTAQDAGRRRKQVARALNGVTPYAVADLAFDISGTGPNVDVAVIARETLAEAEAFATEHQFNPVSFAAVPDAPGFANEAFFGQTGCAADHLNDGQRVDREQTPLVILGRDLPVQDASPGEGSSETPAAVGPDAVAARGVAPEPDDPALPADPDLPADPAAADDPAAIETQPVGLVPVTDDPVGNACGAPAAKTEQLSADVAQNMADDAAMRVDASVPTTPAVVRDTGPTSELEPEEVLAKIFETENAQSPFLALPDPAVADRDDSSGADVPNVSAASNPATAGDPLLMIFPRQIIEPQFTDPPVLQSPVAHPADEAPIALDVVDDLPDDRGAAPPRAQAGVLDPSIPDDVPPPPPAQIMVAFGSRRALEASAKEAATKAGSPRAAAARPTFGKSSGPGGISANRSGPQAKVTTLAPRPSQPSVVRMQSRPSGSLGDLTGNAVKPGAQTASKQGAAGKTTAAGKVLRGLGALVTSPGIAGGKERRTVVQMVTPPTGPSSAAAAAAATLTRAGAKPYSGGLGNRSMERAKPRYLGLILTGILLVFLVLVAAWSTLFLESRDTTTPDPNAVVEAAPSADDVTATDEADADTNAVDPEMLADLQGPAATDAGVVANVAPEIVADAEADAVAAAVAKAVAETPVEPNPATALDTRAAEAVPPQTAPQDEFLLATMDKPPSMPDALSMPQPVARNDAPPGPSVPPPPFGTVYQFDADGMIVPTPNGILTPEGVLLFAGRPALEPPPRPASLAPATPTPVALPFGTPALVAGAVAADGATVGATDGATDGNVSEAAPVFADPALADARPRPRPEALMPPTQNADDDASLVPEAASRFASLLPRARPAGLIAVAAVAPAPDPIAGLGAQGASLTAQADAVAASAAEARSNLTLAVSRKPAPRPKDMLRPVEVAVAVASRQPDPAPPVEEPTARTEPEADDEPEIAKAMPRLPTSTSVAKQATFVNAINLSKVNLIGVFGSASDRYALIRQPNGRYKKVKVGDNFDGGRVAAITTSEVRYQKSGKMITLALPKG